jgi:hypothetical protein
MICSPQTAYPQRRAPAQFKRKLDEAEDRVTHLEHYMSLAHKTNAKYGAKIPAAPNTGAKQAQPAKQGEAEDASAKVQQAPKKDVGKKR